MFKGNIFFKIVRKGILLKGVDDENIKDLFVGSFKIK